MKKRTKEDMRERYQVLIAEKKDPLTVAKIMLKELHDEIKEFLKEDDNNITIN